MTVRGLVGPPASGKTHLARDHARVCARGRVLEPLGGGEPFTPVSEMRRVGARGIARAFLGQCVHHVHVDVSDDDARGGGVSRLAGSVCDLHLVVEEYRLLRGGAKGPEGLAKLLRVHRHRNVTADLLSQRMVDVPPDTRAVVNQWLIFGAMGERERSAVRQELGARAHALLSVLAQAPRHSYIFVDMKHPDRARVMPPVSGD